MLQSMDGCWHRLSSLDLHFKPVRRQPLHREPAAPGLPGLPGDISISKNKLEFVCKYLSNIFQLTLPCWHHISPLPTPPGCLAHSCPCSRHCQQPSPRCPGWCGGSGTRTGSARAGAGTPGKAGAPHGTGWSPAAHREGFSSREKDRRGTERAAQPQSSPEITTLSPTTHHGAATAHGQHGPHRAPSPAAQGSLGGTEGHSQQGKQKLLPPSPCPNREQPQARENNMGAIKAPDSPV